MGRGLPKSKTGGWQIMKRISITRLFAMVPPSNRMTTFALSRSDPTPFTKLRAIYVRLESISHISVELCHGKNKEVLCVDIRAGDVEFGYEDAIEIRQLVTDIQKAWDLPVLARPVVLSFLSHLTNLGANRTANAQDLTDLIESHPRENASGWWNH